MYGPKNIRMLNTALLANHTSNIKIIVLAV